MPYHVWREYVANINLSILLNFKDFGWTIFGLLVQVRPMMTLEVPTSNPKFSFMIDHGVKEEEHNLLRSLEEDVEGKPLKISLNGHSR